MSEVATLKFPAPKHCGECMLKVDCGDPYGVDLCYGRTNRRGYKPFSYESRPDWCPLEILEITEDEDAGSD